MLIRRNRLMTFIPVYIKLLFLFFFYFTTYPWDCSKIQVHNFNIEIKRKTWKKSCVNTTIKCENKYIYDVPYYLVPWQEKVFWCELHHFVVRVFLSFSAFRNSLRIWCGYITTVINDSLHDDRNDSRSGSCGDIWSSTKLNHQDSVQPYQVQSSLRSESFDWHDNTSDTINHHTIILIVLVDIQGIVFFCISHEKCDVS